MALVVELLKKCKIAEPRQCGSEDLEWILDLAVRRYKKFDVDGAALWLRAALEHSSVCVAADSGSVGVVSLISPSWEPGEIFAVLNFLVSPEPTASPFAVIRLMRFFAEWSRNKGASEFRFGNNSNDTNRDVDFAIVARRLGAKDITEPYFSLSLEKIHGT